MHIPKINILLTTLGITHDDIAEAIGVTRSMITRTIAGNRKSKRTQDRIANYIREQITAESLFGTEPGPIQPHVGEESGLRSTRKRADLI